MQSSSFQHENFLIPAEQFCNNFLQVFFEKFIVKERNEILFPL